MQDTIQEIFDIVDENDVPLGITKPRNVVHQELKDWHRVTGIFILNDKEELLCQQRSLQKDVNPGQWQCFFEGHLKTGETYLQNAIIEIEEELGLQLHDTELIAIGKGTDEEHKHHIRLFVYHCHHNNFHFSDGEVNQVQYSEIVIARILTRK